MKTLTTDERAKSLDHRISDHETRLARHREILSRFNHSNEMDLAFRQGAVLAGQLAELQAARAALTEGDTDNG